MAGVAGEAQGSELFALCFALAALEPLLAGKELGQNGPGRRRSSERPWQPRIYLDEFHQGVLDSGAARSTSSTHVRPNDAGSVRGAGGAGRCGGARDKKRGRSRSRAGGRRAHVTHPGAWAPNELHTVERDARHHLRDDGGESPSPVGDPGHLTTSSMGRPSSPFSPCSSSSPYPHRPSLHQALSSSPE